MFKSHAVDVCLYKKKNKKNMGNIFVTLFRAMCVNNYFPNEFHYNVSTV